MYIMAEGIVTQRFMPKSTTDVRVQFVNRSTGGFVAAVTPGWGVVKTVVKTNRVFQLSPAALGVRVGE